MKLEIVEAEQAIQKGLGLDRLFPLRPEFAAQEAKHLARALDGDRR